MLKNVKIGKRLIIVFLIAVLIASIAGVVGIALLQKSDTDYSEIVVNYGFSQGVLGDFDRNFQAHRTTIIYLLTAPDEKQRVTYEQQLVEQDKLIDESLLQMGDTITIENGDAIYEKLKKDVAEFRKVRSELIAKSETTSNDNAVMLEELKTMLRPTSVAISEVINGMINDKTDVGAEKSGEQSAAMIRFIIIMYSVLGAGIVIAMTLAVIVSKGISKPLAEIEQSALKMSEGNFDVVINYESGDEVGMLANSMRNMTKNTKLILSDVQRALDEIAKGNFDIIPGVEYIGVFKQVESSLTTILEGLSETMAQIQTAASQVSTGSEQVSAGAQSLAQSTTEQASAVQELSASVSEIAEQTNSTAKNANKTNELARSVSIKVVSSNEQMQKMLSAMEEINSSSTEISKIIKTIEDIAFQTNILALNAAVEAARAGEAGKGFAVVADEVRNLASKSAQAAKQTTALIDSSVQSVENGSKIAQEAARSLIEVVEGSKQMTDLISKISTASTEQSASVDQINAGIDQIATVVQTNSATSEQSAAASEELSSQANLMRGLVSKFSLCDNVTKSTLSSSSMMHLPSEENHNTDKY